MAKQNKRHPPITSELSVAARKMMKLTAGLPTNLKGLSRTELTQTLEGFVTVIQEVDLTADDLDAIDDLLEQFAYPETNRREKDAIFAAFLVRAAIMKDKDLQPDMAYDEVATELGKDKSTVGKHYRKYFPKEP